MRDATAAIMDAVVTLQVLYEVSDLVTLLLGMAMRRRYGSYQAISRASSSSHSANPSRFSLS